MAVDDYRLSDDGNEPPPVNYVRPKRNKFSVQQVRAVIENLNIEDSDAEFTDDDDAGTDGKLAGASRDTAVVLAEMSAVSPSKKQKLALEERSDSRDGSHGSDVEDEEDSVEPDASPDEFINQVKTKLMVIASDLGTCGADGDDDGDHQPRRNRLSLKKTGANNWDPDSRDGHAADSTGARNQPRCLPVWKQKPVMMSAEDMEDWDRIESLPDSDVDEPANLQSQPSGVQASDDELELPDVETPKGRSTKTSDAEKKKRTPVHQVVKPNPSKTEKYHAGSDMLDDSDDEIAVEEDDSDDDNFLSLSSSSPVAASQKCRSPSKKLTSSFWLASPASKKSALNTDYEDDDDDDDEFVSNSASQ